MLKADFHMHTWFSRDSMTSPKELLGAARKAGLDVIAVTDHNSVKGGLEVRKIAKGILVIVGQEVMTLQGEIIVLGPGKSIEPLRDVKETCRKAKKMGGFIIVPHPFDTTRKGMGNEIETILKYVDAIEGLNARTLLNSMNRKGVDFAKKHSLPLVAGSDSHLPYELGRAYTLVDSEKAEKNVLKAISEGKTEMKGKGSGIKPHIDTFIIKRRKKPIQAA